MDASDNNPGAYLTQLREAARRMAAEWVAEATRMVAATAGAAEALASGRTTLARVVAGIADIEGGDVEHRDYLAEALADAPAAVRALADSAPETLALAAALAVACSPAVGRA